MKINRFVSDPKGARIGYIYAESDIAIYRRLTLFEKNGRRWIQFASENSQKKNEKGYDIYESFWELKDKKKMQAFYDAVLSALDEWLKSGNRPEQKQEQQQAAPAYVGSNFQDCESPPF